MESPEDLATYWERRLSKRLDLSTVGHIGMGLRFNTWLYRMRASSLSRGLKRFHVDPRGARVVDFGVGSGAWVPFWEKAGVGGYTGYDITSVSVTELTKRHPRHRFLQANIGEPMAFPESYDLATAFDVLFHLVSDEEFGMAIHNMGRSLRPGGIAILSDGFADQAYGPFPTEYHRKLADYSRVFSSVGLSLLGFQPVFLTMHPCLSRETPAHRFLDGVTKVVAKVASRIARYPTTEWMNQYLGAGLYGVDRVFGPFVGKGPSLNLAFLVRR